MAKVYITTTLPYVNADPHIGFALEIIQADVWVRAQRLMGNEVVFNTGTDEHGLKIYQNAKDENKDTQQYVDEYAAKFNKLKEALDLTYTNFIRTTDAHHKKAAQVFWKLCQENGDIYKKNYKIKYCVGCELAKTDSELVNGKCPLHPNKELMIIEEENFFFKFSRFQEKLLKHYKNNPDFVKPSNRLQEVTNFVKGGLEDFSISRLKKNMPWGVPVPGDDDHVMYVWFDALINYISTLGWPEDEKNFNDFWPGIQVAGKDNLRQQAAMWQAMLMSACLPPSKQIFIHGFITMNGEKISKSTGNVVNPFDLVNKYGTDAVRYFLLREIPSLDDGDFSIRRFEEVFNADLANTIGNLVARVTTLCQQNNVVFDEKEEKDNNVKTRLEKGGFSDHVNKFEFNLALEELWREYKMIDNEINKYEPWKKQGEELITNLKNYLKNIREITHYLQPFLPNTAEKIMKATSGKIQKIKPLFPRLQK